jgi:5'-AMP-activated protein kinase catalytic alpha subunit
VGLQIMQHQKSFKESKEFYLTWKNSNFRQYSGNEVDVWSMGVILYAMLCGQLPFDDDSISNLFCLIREGKYYMPHFLSEEVKDLINRMLQVNPIKRITLKNI